MAEEVAVRVGTQTFTDAQQASAALSDVVAHQQRQTEGKSFEEVFVKPAASGRSAQWTAARRKEKEDILKHIPRQVWSIINLMPFPLKLNSTLHQQLPNSGIVPPCEPGVEYVPYILDKVCWDVATRESTDENEDHHEPMFWLPSQLAEDYSKEFIERQGVGGVIVLEGRFNPTNPTHAHVLADAKTARNRYAMMRVEHAGNLYSESKGTLISDTDRKLARILKDAGELQELPPWVMQKLDPSQNRVQCPSCRQFSPSGSLKCTGCKDYIFDPLRAYENSMIEFGHVSMDRLDADGWKKAAEIKRSRDAARKAAMGEAEEEQTEKPKGKK